VEELLLSVIEYRYQADRNNAELLVLDPSPFEVAFAIA
jgi:hypothetical protein